MSSSDTDSPSKKHARDGSAPARSSTAIGVGLVGIYVKDQQKAKQFFVEKLNFKVYMEFKMGDEPVDMGVYGRFQYWIELESPAGGQHLALFTHPGHEDRVGTFSNIVLDVVDLKAAVEELRAKHVTIVQEPEVTFWGGQQAMIKDDEGNVYALYQKSNPSDASSS